MEGYRSMHGWDQRPFRCKLHCMPICTWMFRILNLDLKETTLSTPLSTIPSHITNMVKPQQKPERTQLVSRGVMRVGVMGDWWGRSDKLRLLAPGLVRS